MEGGASYCPGLPQVKPRWHPLDNLQPPLTIRDRIKDQTLEQETILVLATLSNLQGFQELCQKPGTETNTYFLFSYSNFILYLVIFVAFLLGFNIKIILVSYDWDYLTAWGKFLMKSCRPTVDFWGFEHDFTFLKGYKVYSYLLPLTALINNIY